VKLSHRERQLLALLVVLLIIFIGLEVFARLYEAFIRVADVFIIFGAAWAFAYLLSPLVNATERRTRLNRVGAVFVVYAAIAVVFGGILAIAVPGLAGQLDSLRSRAPELAANTADAAKGLQEQLDRAGVPVNVGELVAGLPQRVGDAAGNVAADALGFVTATAAILFNLTLVLIIAFLMLLDGGSLWLRFTAALPVELRSEAELFRQSADKSFGGFVRGSLLLGLFYGIATLVYLVPLAVPFAGVLALVAGLAVVVIALRRMGLAPSAGSVLTAIVVVGCGVVMTYSVWFMVVTLVLHVERFGNVHFVFYSVVELARVPVQAFPLAARLVLAYLVPAAFISTFPSQALLSTLEMGNALLGVLAAAGLLWLSSVFWNYSLRRYVSASS